MESRLNPFYSTPVAIILGAIIISGAILINGGYIKLGKLAGKSSPTTQAPAPPGQPQVAKTEADIVKSLKSEAKKLNLDQKKFDVCLDSNSKADLVKADLDDGTKVGINGTPGFFINGRIIEGAVPYSQFKTVIDEELAGNTPAGVERKTVGVGNLPLQGSENAKVTLIEFSDYQCPFCSRYFIQTESQLKKEYIDTGKVKFYYRDFPLSSIHPGAQKAAEAARCAGDQGKYWEYHDAIFANQTTIF